MIVYHITLTRNLSKVMSGGLVPKIGRRSSRLGEKTAAIYFFPSMSEVENGLENWMMNEFGEEARLSLLRVSIPPTVKVYSDAAYECHVCELIATSNIQVLSKDVLGEVELPNS